MNKKVSNKIVYLNFILAFLILNLHSAYMELFDFLPTPQGVRLHDAPVQKEISFGLWRYGSPGIRHSQCLMPFG